MLKPRPVWLILMRILYFSRDYTTHDRRFLLKLAQSSHQIYFLRLEDDGIPYENRLLPEKVHPIDWAGGRQPYKSIEAWLGLMPAFETVLNDLQPDLVHAGPVQSCGFMTALANFHPFMVMSWGSDILVDTDRNDTWRWVTRYTLEHSDMLVCDSDSVRKKVKQIIPYPNERIVQFPWGINLQRFQNRKSLNLRQELGWGKNSLIVLSTRSWEPIYGIDILLEAFRQVYTKNADLRLALLGTGSQSPEIQRFIETHRLGDVVFQPGVVPNEQIPDYFLSADLYMSCAYSDGTSISLLEAMAGGLPVIVTDGPGNREWVAPGENGWLAPAGSAEVFATSLLQAASQSKVEQTRISRNNRQVAESRANWDANIIKLLEAYERFGSDAPDC